MARTPRLMPAGYAYHVLNRASGQQPIFAAAADARRFVEVLAAAVERVPEAGLLAWCLMPNHWHLVFHPSADNVVQRLLQWLSLTHAQRHRTAHRSVGTGHVYQGRYRSFPVATDAHLLTVIRYVERNPLRAGVVDDATAWPWSSASRPARRGYRQAPALVPWPIARPADWLSLLNRPATAAEEAAERQRLCRSLERGSPYGSAEWVAAAVAQLDLGATTRQPGRPRGEGRAKS